MIIATLAERFNKRTSSATGFESLHHSWPSSSSPCGDPLRKRVPPTPFESKRRNPRPQQTCPENGAHTETDRIAAMLGNCVAVSDHEAAWRKTLDPSHLPAWQAKPFGHGLSWFRATFLTRFEVRTSAGHRLQKAISKSLNHSVLDLDGALIWLESTDIEVP